MGYIKKYSREVVDGKKYCGQCKKQLPVECFGHSKTVKSGFSSYCKGCNNRKAREKYQNRQEKNYVSHEDRRVKDGLKLCSKCGRRLPAENFTKDGATKSGLASACKECNNVKDKKKVKGFRTCKRCGELKPLNQFVGIVPVCYSCKLPKSIKIYDCEKDRRRAEKHRRKARQRNLLHDFTSKQWNEAKAIFENKCAYCGSEDNLTQDHFIPLSKGGGYTQKNIIPVCSMCNSQKRDLDFFEWYPQQPFYSKKREQKILEYLNYKCGFQQIAL